MISKPSSSFAVMISSWLSSVINWHASTRSPLMRPAMVALAKPGPMSSATSNTETGLSNARCEPSGRVIIGMFCPCYSGDAYNASHAVNKVSPAFKTLLQ